VGQADRQADRQSDTRPLHYTYRHVQYAASTITGTAVESWHYTYLMVFTCDAMIEWY